MSEAERTSSSFVSFHLSVSEAPKNDQKRITFSNTKRRHELNWKCREMDFSLFISQKILGTQLWNSSWASETPINRASIVTYTHTHDRRLQCTHFVSSTSFGSEWLWMHSIWLRSFLCLKQLISFGPFDFKWRNFENPMASRNLTLIIDTFLR